jgi:hypothetical protein
MARTADALEAFTLGYAYATLWANTHDDHDGDVCPEAWQTPAAGWELEAFTPDARARIEQDCADFFAGNLRDLWAYVREQGPVSDRHAFRSAGHDFALTRNRHGAGFWDRGLGDLGARLTDAAHAYGEQTGMVDLDDPSALVSL